ncbi:uncharacterized protein BDW47DRAFT_114328 [Aspergillus candidus]|uniref:Uncharacterized protein n=1 Tax=Aspergillus candidus TaxID=41067 RepID=A0A2I2EXY9_ASPCN|nr:hypothetical protein BDW47DRAFT_114328 [Aspergillus candidus]PLB33245.1 hypothetical protein BDW47DRAFT_114328 [Aspergillus candidus]
MSDKRPMTASLSKRKADNGDHSDRPTSSSEDSNEKPPPKSLRYKSTVFFLALVAVGDRLTLRTKNASSG